MLSTSTYELLNTSTSQFKKYFSENIPFEDIININSNFEKEMNNIRLRALMNIGKLALNLYNLEYMDMLNELSKFYQSDDNLLEFADSVMNIINLYFKELDSCLSIKNNNDLDELTFILQLFSIDLEEVIESKNIELAYGSFFNLERRITKYGLYNNYVKLIYGDNNFTFKMECINNEDPEDCNARTTHIMEEF